MIGFKNKVDKGAKNLAEAHGVRVIISEIIYDLVKALEEYLILGAGPAKLGELEVLKVFSQKKLDKQLVGGKILEGIFRNRGNFEVIRMDGEVKKTVGTGRIVSLHEGKAEIAEAAKGKEIGLLVNATAAIQVGDKIVVNK